MSNEALMSLYCDTSGMPGAFLIKLTAFNWRGGIQYWLCSCFSFLVCYFWASCSPFVHINCGLWCLDHWRRFNLMSTNDCCQTFFFNLTLASYFSDFPLTSRSLISRSQLGFTLESNKGIPVYPSLCLELSHSMCPIRIGPHHFLKQVLDSHSLSFFTSMHPRQSHQLL